MSVWIGLWRCLCVLPKRLKQVEGLGLQVGRLTEVSSVLKVREFRRVLRAREMRGQMWLKLSFEVKRRFVNYGLCFVLNHHPYRDRPKRAYATERR